MHEHVLITLVHGRYQIFLQSESARCSSLHVNSELGRLRAIYCDGMLALSVRATVAIAGALTRELVLLEREALVLLLCQGLKGAAMLLAGRGTRECLVRRQLIDAIHSHQNGVRLAQLRVLMSDRSIARVE